MINVIKGTRWTLGTKLLYCLRHKHKKNGSAEWSKVQYVYGCDFLSVCTINYKTDLVYMHLFFVCQSALFPYGEWHYYSLTSEGTSSEKSEKEKKQRELQWSRLFFMPVPLNIGRVRAPGMHHTQKGLRCFCCLAPREKYRHT